MTQFLPLGSWNKLTLFYASMPQRWSYKMFCLLHCHVQCHNVCFNGNSYKKLFKIFLKYVMRDFGLENKSCFIFLHQTSLVQVSSPNVECSPLVSALSHPHHIYLNFRSLIKWIIRK